ncbi:hypothetical protein vB_PsyM_KIL3b_0145 [Pseudomonas phage vB_PsyM_KIL3b]|uniref:Uncharacterized protein n=6 Tax=Flaumdravirus TaxID=2560133 RepID=A0A142IF73_9CAUD|nr:hypothetical protein BH774_gp058 [Pseudomonas phage vB_PsyM_KIL1]YP_009616831.1 hypothetical protein FDI83_gp059 [Pseudomonas phage vB_PsyM_KIL4]AMR57552.1 hypothetical protein vB_PsyM_KIL2_0152 [Pseudomonas phage vB_PsyM_KIL2]AMR57712.1 hypothetical protein vB_PsyM_KIL3_0145 [Pseudomonas phage vB_PsyM_KIL3]AMR58047.1 hypothetical protein vB_PsyM_KIL5_0156 [Pseudomonas phage vB_PsyM_KIL5]AMR58210.1 hypothetical protein vB_PsyM_KIL3b_0145 [Pseudomonas phage vB_PsyM_KIL3b]AMR57391.1 hypothet
MINYEQKEDYIKFKWKRKELGRIYNEDNSWHYRPTGCQGQIRSEEFSTLTALKHHLEYGETYSV